MLTNSIADALAAEHPELLADYSRTHLGELVRVFVKRLKLAGHVKRHTPPEPELQRCANRFAELEREDRNDGEEVQYDAA